MKIKAAVLEEFGRPLEVQEVDLAEPKAGEVSAFGNDKKRIAKSLAAAQRLWDAKTAEQRAELTLTPDDSLP